MFGIRPDGRGRGRAGGNTVLQVYCDREFSFIVVQEQKINFFNSRGTEKYTGLQFYRFRKKKEKSYIKNPMY